MVGRSQTKKLCGGLVVLRTILILLLPAVGLVMWQTRPQPLDLSEKPTQEAQEQVAGQELPQLNWYAPLWQRDLKQPPIPPKVVEAPPEPPKPAGPTPKLVATFVEPEGQYAHFVDNRGRTQMRGVDELIDGFVVTAIEPGRVCLSQGDRVVWVDMPKKGKG